MFCQNFIRYFSVQYLSPLLCGCRKDCSRATTLLYLIENWKFILDKKVYTVAIQMNLSKAFDIINHELLAAKVNAYEFIKEALKLIFSYLSNRKQRVKINKTWK